MMNEAFGHQGTSLGVKQIRLSGLPSLMLLVITKKPALFS
jgi:hypothetical protein